MKPFYKLSPSYRYGTETPWGGDALGRLFGKHIPDDRTGEALEASTLPGLESTTEDGQTLTALAGGALPLLLKLLDAREALSVQVHPDDAYAAAHEGGKLGKTEAWYILDAKPGAKLVYGLTPGTQLDALTPETIEAHLRWVDVRAGDVLYIPAGMVHAIGPGIVLYEIQESSDVTYRFWDWDKRDAQGNARPLHWAKACDVANVSLQLEPTRGEESIYPGGSITRYLANHHFSLMRYDVKSRLKLRRHKGFQYMTALSDGQLICGEASLPFVKGDTMYIPRDASGIVIEGACEVLVSREGYQPG